jgi:hypothetical protein
MAKRPIPDPDDLDEAVTKLNDPGGAHTKGYSAETGSAPDVPAEGPIPLAPDDGGAILRPKRGPDVKPTGRSEPGDYTPNDRLMGSDR